MRQPIALLAVSLVLGIAGWAYGSVGATAAPAIATAAPAIDTIPGWPPGNDQGYTPTNDPLPTQAVSDVPITVRETPVGAVAEPATIIIWSLLGGGSWLGMRVWRRVKGAGRRQPWSPENRQAIQDIIARGRGL